LTRGDRSLMGDILDAAQHLAEIVELGEEHFHESWKDFRAAERLLEIIGEAASNLSEDLRSRLPDLPVSKAKGMRNVIAHQYVHVDRHLVWQAITADVPKFAAELATDLDSRRESSAAAEPETPSL